MMVHASTRNLAHGQVVIARVKKGMLVQRNVTTQVWELHWAVLEDGRHHIHIACPHSSKCIKLELSKWLSRKVNLASWMKIFYCTLVYAFVACHSAHVHLLIYLYLFIDTASPASFTMVRNTVFGNEIVRMKWKQINSRKSEWVQYKRKRLHQHTVQRFRIRKWK